MHTFKPYIVVPIIFLAKILKRPIKSATSAVFLLGLVPNIALAIDTDCRSERGQTECRSIEPGPDRCNAGYPEPAIQANSAPCGYYDIAHGIYPEDVIPCTEDESWRIADTMASEVPSICFGPVRQNLQHDIIYEYHGIITSEVMFYDAVRGFKNNQGECIISTNPLMAQSACTRALKCPPGYLMDSENGICKRYKPELCPVGNPIQCSGGTKVQSETDIYGFSGNSMEFNRYYSSSGFYFPASANRLRDTLGFNWRHTYQRTIVVEEAIDSSHISIAHAVRPNGDYRHFTLSGSTWTGRLDSSDTLTELTSAGHRIGWTYVTDDDTTETYDAEGRLLKIAAKTGATETLTYSDSSTPPNIAPASGLLIRVTNHAGRSINMDYNAKSLLDTITSPDGNVYTYRYDAMDRLAFVDYPGIQATTRSYTYSTSNSASRELLVGITDENNVRYATYDYDVQDRVNQEHHAVGIDTLNIIYDGNYLSTTGSTVVTDALGNIDNHRFIAINGVFKDAGIDRCTTTACTTITQSTHITYDAHGNRDLVTDFNGIVTDHDYDTRGLETKRVEASNTSGANAPKRTIETAWHPTFRVPVSRTTRNANNVLEAKTTWSYNPRGQAVARCDIDPADPLAMAYSCSATTAPPAGAKVRRTVTTYCEPASVTAGTCPLVGLVTAVNGPRPAGDAGMGSGQDDVTTYTYYQTDDPTCASGGACPHRHGDPWKVTNALGHVVETVAYDKNGRVTRTKDANGTLTDFVYHPRGWLTDRIVRVNANGFSGPGDAITHIDYDAVGNVRKVTQPDGAFLAYTYDDAHRLIKIADNLGNTIDYCPGGVGSAQCLDAAGNRRVEQVKDPSGTIKRALARQYNQLGQLVRVTNAAGLPVEQSQGLSDTGVADGYDGNGNRVLVQDGLGTTTKQRYDGLNRLVETVQDLAGTDPATAGTATGYAYDARDNLRQVTDPDGLATVYDYDGLDHLTGLHSPDTGNAAYTYDLAGNRTGQTDARGIASTDTYDALNRLTGIAYPTAGLNVAYAYDQPNATTGCAASWPLGRLTRMTDASGSTTWCYDRRGNVTQKTQVANGTPRTTGYTYTVADRLASITYPSGAIVTYARDALGRVKTVTWKNGGSTTTLVADAAYYPFGPLGTLTWGNGRTLTKTYDADYAIDAIASSAATGLKLDFAVDVMGNVVSSSASIGASPPDRRYGYDALYRLTTAQTGATPPVPQEAYTYGPTGDRLSAQLGGGTVVPYAYSPGTHRLASVGGVARGYDANGNTQSGIAGLTLTYDDRNRLASATSGSTTTNYQYNGRGERVGKSVATGGFGGSSTTYVYDETGRLIGEYAGTTAKAEYVYLDDTPIAVVKANVVAYIETDHLGTPRQVVDPATNAPRWTWDFLGNAFGAQAPNESPAGGPAYVLNLRLPGQYFDAETGINYNYLRDYEPQTGRYIESDPIGLPAGMSTYSYGLSDPIYWSDALGLDVDINLFPPGSDAYNFAQKYPGMPNECTIAGHGTPTSLAGLTAGDLAKIIPNYPKCINKPIRLLACNTGVRPPHGKPFGKSLAQNTGQPVFAPNNWGWLHSDGRFGIGPANPQVDWRMPNAEDEAMSRKPACECGAFVQFNP